MFESVAMSLAVGLASSMASGAGQDPCDDEQACGFFSPGVSYPAAERPTVLAASDLNGDGSLDLVVTVNNGREFFVMLGRSDGTFEDGFRFRFPDDSISTLSRELTAGDFNGDGLGDVASFNSFTENPFQGSVSVMLGNRDSILEFRSESLFPHSQSSDGSLAVGDLDLDGSLDLVASSEATDETAVFLGRGDGSFQPLEAFGLGGGAAFTAIADTDLDGFLDLVYEVLLLDLRSLLGRGDGTFEAPIGISTEQVSGPLLIGDLTGDGFIDALVLGRSAGAVLLLPALGLGDGTFLLGESLVTTVNLSPKIDGSLVDINLDGHLDLAMSSLSASGRVSVYLGRGDGTFAADQSYEAGIAPYAMTTGDFNGDGWVDLAVANIVSEDVSVLLNRGSNAMRRGDCDASGSVTFGDLVAMLFEFGEACSCRCDADRDGTVDFADLVEALSLLGT